jgi:hypothetical protein
MDFFIMKLAAGAPSIQSLTVDRDTLVQGGELTLTTQGVFDAGGDVVSVAFYHDADGDGLLNTAVDELLEVDNNSADGWSLATSTVGWALGANTAFALATDNDGLESQPVSTAVQITAPSVANENDMYVWDITAETRTRGNKKDARIVVVVRRDSNTSGTAGATDTVVSAASVTVALRNSVGALVGTGTGSTDANGRFVSGWFSNLANGTYVAEIGSLTHLTFVWNQNLDPTANDSDLDSDGMPDQAFSVPGGQSILAAASSTTTGNLQMRTPVKHSRLPMDGNEKNISLLLTTSADSSAAHRLANGSMKEVEDLAPSPLRRLAAVDAALAEFAQDWSEVLLLHT